MIDGLFIDQEGSPDGIGQAEISDIQNIINKSMEDSPDMMRGMDFNDGAVGAAFNDDDMDAYDDDYYDELPDGMDRNDLNKLLNDYKHW